MSKFSSRHPGPELMDKNDIPAKDLFLNYKELDFINRWLGGYRITLKGLGKLLNKRREAYSVLDVGCGGGDMLMQIKSWSGKKGIRLRLTGIDLSEAAIEYASMRHADPAVSYVREDVSRHLKSGASYDVIISSLFMHHLSDERITELLHLMYQTSRVGIVINDLQRNPVAYQSIRMLTQLFSSSYLVKHDAPLSVLRGFYKKEWEQVASDAGIKMDFCRWQWAFRHLIVIKK